METLKVNIKFKWEKVNTDLSKCRICEEVIYGNTYRLFVISFCDDTEKSTKPSSLILCESCYQLIKHNYK